MPSPAASTHRRNVSGLGRLDASLRLPCLSRPVRQAAPELAPRRAAFAALDTRSREKTGNLFRTASRTPRLTGRKYALLTDHRKGGELVAEWGGTLRERLDSRLVPEGQGLGLGKLRRHTGQKQVPRSCKPRSRELSCFFAAERWCLHGIAERGDTTPGSVPGASRAK